MVTAELFESGYSYESYRKLIDELLTEDKTTGDNHSEDYLNYTKMNVQRMNRMDKTIDLSDELRSKLKDLPCKLNWLVLTEAWCGDAAQNVPILAKIAAQSDNINLRLLLRDEHLEIMDQYLTNGGRAIPKLAVFDEQFNELATWGPRPDEVQEMVLENKRTEKLPYQEFAKVVQKWYAKDKGKSLQLEIQELLEEIDCLAEH